MEKLSMINAKQLAIGMTIFDPIGLETTVTIIDFFTLPDNKRVIASTINVIGFEDVKGFSIVEPNSSFKLAEPFHLPINCDKTHSDNEATLFDWMNSVDGWSKERTLFVLKKQNFSERVVKAKHPPIYFHSFMSDAFLKEMVAYLRTKSDKLEHEHVIEFLTLLGAEISNAEHHSYAHEIYIWEQKNQDLRSWVEREIRDVYTSKKHMVYDIIYAEKASHALSSKQVDHVKEVTPNDK